MRERERERRHGADNVGELLASCPTSLCKGLTKTDYDEIYDGISGIKTRCEHESFKTVVFTCLQFKNGTMNIARIQERMVHAVNVT